MVTLRQFNEDVDVVIGRGDFNLRKLHYSVAVDLKTLTIKEDEPVLREFFGAQYEGIFDDCAELTLVPEHFENAQFNPFDFERREKAIALLSAEHPKCASVHPVIKSLIPTTDLELLAERGFMDCSWGNDECPSFYIPNKGECFGSESNNLIYVHDDVNCDGERVSNDIKYAVFVDSEFCATYPDVSSAIERCLG
jgi:hypothetical protein